MAQTLFKRLCNIDFWHEYYLPWKNNVPYFGLSPQEQQEVLTETFFHQRYRFGQDVSIVPTPATEERLKDYRIKYANTPQGLVLGCSVKTVDAADGSTRYRPQINFPADLRLDFQVRVVNPAFLIFTNGRLKTVLPTRYLFTNNNPAGGKVFPDLALPTSDFDPGYLYEPGEAINNGTQRELAVRRTSSSADFASKHNELFVGEADRLLLPMRFNVQLAQATETVTIDVQDINGDPVGNSLELSFPTPRRNVLIPLDELELNPGDSSLPNQLLTLSITAPGFAYERQVIIDDERYDEQSYGTISVFTQPTTGFSLLDNNGFLMTYLDAAGQVIASPRLEVKLEARPTIWRYRSRYGRGLEFLPAVTMADVTEVAGGFLETNDPLPYRNQPRFFGANNGGSPGDVLLPNPTPKYFQELDGRFVTDIYIDSINNLITEV